MLHDEDVDLDAAVAPGSWKMLLDNCVHRMWPLPGTLPGSEHRQASEPQKFMMDLGESALDHYDSHAGLDVLSMAS